MRLREVLEPPEATGVERFEEEDHLSTRHVPHLPQPPVEIGPVVHGEDRHGHGEGAVGKSEAPRRRRGSRARARPALAQHRGRRLDRHDEAIGGFVAPGPGADVQHRPSGPRHAWTASAIRGSCRRVRVYERPMSSYLGAGASDTGGSSRCYGSGMPTDSVTVHVDAPPSRCGRW